jgi:hypothetical protein
VIRPTERLNLAGRALALAAAALLAWISPAAAQTAIVQHTTMQQATIVDAADPNTWPAAFSSAQGPWAWVDGPSYLQKDPQLANGVYGGIAGGNGELKLYVCRAAQQDGVHPGKYFNGQCNVGWGGQEIVLTQGYELLVNTRPDVAPYLTQRWVDQGVSEGTFYGGSVGTTWLRVCRLWWGRADYTHPGKEWSGRCLIGYGGKEEAGVPYQVLSLGFDKAAWLARPVAPSPTVNLAPLTLNTQSPVTLQDGGTINTGSPDPTQGLQVSSTKILYNYFVVQAAGSDNFMGPVLTNAPIRHVYSIDDMVPPPAFFRSYVQAGTPLRIDTAAGWQLDADKLAEKSAGVWFSQEQVYSEAGAGSFRIRWFNTGLCVDAGSEGAVVQLNTCSDAPGQNWRSMAAQHGPVLVAAYKKVTTGDSGLSSMYSAVDRQTAEGLALTFDGANKNLKTSKVTITSAGLSGTYTPLNLRSYPKWEYNDDVAGGKPQP